MALGSHACGWWWTRCPLEVLSNLKHSVTLWSSPFICRMSEWLFTVIFNLFPITALEKLFPLFWQAMARRILVYDGSCWTFSGAINILRIMVFKLWVGINLTALQFCDQASKFVLSSNVLMFKLLILIKTISTTMYLIQAMHF